ncbi:Rrf2 family transcriptional regulator [Jinshanibacter sp. LJY008]|uniref:Rrf2 family transcriptional regulator n=1 Tax=Limnobaculum eriocheiris TaxID=2897391 RepID=A0A9X1MZ18_9GAMM|nr:Rrf2 family transcriptional regulator [Limnobaculum eriocheiris]MCD1126840.1 Rrf2 family transcriptional regulator [Limnobaculum eriocheiris]
MAFVSSGVEYALHCLLYISQRDGVKEANVRDLAELQGVPVDFLAKIFTRLKKSGIVNSTEGARGGFHLARSPESISVKDVIEAVDGDKALFECKEIRERCAVFDRQAPQWATEGVCSIHRIMLDAEQAMRQVFSQHTLASLSASTNKKAPAEFNQQILQWFESRPSNHRVSSE